MIYVRCAAVWTCATATAALAAHWLLAAPPGSGFEHLLLRTCSLTLAACVAWAWLATSAVVLDALRGRPRVRRGVPAALRRVVLAGCGVALVAGASPALATPGPVELSGPVVVVPAVPTLPAPPAPPAHGGVLVHPGDSLWSIASRHLPSNATDQEVTAAWHRLYRHNRAVVGGDPDLLRPGQHLVLPR
jgi:hypothetical protein